MENIHTPLLPREIRERPGFHSGEIADDELAAFPGNKRCPDTYNDLYRNAFYDMLLQAVDECFVLGEEDKHDKTCNDRRCIQDCRDIHFYQAHEL